jgi:hypothetical protein
VEIPVRKIWSSDEENAKTGISGGDMELARVRYPAARSMGQIKGSTVEILKVKVPWLGTNTLIYLRIRHDGEGS